jgi:hypothetical protein
MKVKVRFFEFTVREAVIDAASVEAVEAEWARGYDSELVDEIEDTATEIDGGILWDSAEIGPLR